MRVMILADETSVLKAPTTDVWVRETSERRKVVEELWASSALGSVQITLFTAGPNVTPEEACANVLDNVLLHHPNWTSIEIVGARLTGPLLDALSARGLQYSVSTSAGFIAERLRSH